MDTHFVTTVVSYRTVLHCTVVIACSRRAQKGIPNGGASVKTIGALRDGTAASG